MNNSLPNTRHQQDPIVDVQTLLELCRERAAAPGAPHETDERVLALGAVRRMVRRHEHPLNALEEVAADQRLMLALVLVLHPAWHLPLGYKDGEYGAEKVPSGAYLGDRDMFLFLVDGNRDLDDPTDSTHAGLFRGFILRNSDVGAAALTLDVFLFRQICGNQIIWEFQHVAGFRRRHVGASIQEAWTSSLEGIRAALDADPSADRDALLRASSQELGPTRDAVIEAVLQRLDLTRKQAAEAYAIAELYESNPRSVWGFVQGLTRLSQRTPWQDARFALDRAAGRLLTTVH